MATTRRKKHNPRAERTLTRISGVREVKQTFLIICEGMNTEPDYFNAFRLTSAHVKAVGQGMGTLTLVQKAINIKEQEKQRGRTYNQNWVVFDKDDFPENQGALHRSKYEKMLSALLGFPYTKKSGVSSKMFNVLFPRQEQAIHHAKTVMKQFEGNNPAQQESSTTVYLLVEELNRFL